MTDSLKTKGRVLVKAAKVYDFVQPIVTFGQEHKLNKWVGTQMNIENGDNILDIGCGTGLLTYEIAKKNKLADVIGVDASKPMIDVAIKKRSLENCKYKQALGEDLPFGNEVFTHITSALFFHHINEELKEKCLMEIYRTLIPGGVLLIADMDIPYTKLGYLTSYLAWKVLRQPEIKENMNGLVRKLVEKTGFVNIEKIGQFSGYISILRAEKERV